jgi:hypothetical protein
MVLVDGYELTGDSHKVLLTEERQQYDVTAFGDQVHPMVNGVRQASLEHHGWLNPQAARSHPILKGVSIQGVVSVLLGQNAAPTLGDPMHSLVVAQGHYQALPEVAKAVPFTAKFANRGDLGGWGRALCVPTSLTTTTTGATLDQGAATTAGGAVCLHVLTAAATDRYSLVVQGSTTGAFAGEQTTLATFSLNGAAVGSERLSLTGTIPRYTRYIATRTGSAAQPVRVSINLVRF